MKVKITKSVLLDNLKIVQNIVPAKGTLPILQNVKMDAKDGKLIFTCSDLNQTIITEGSCEVIEEGSTTIPVSDFVAAVSVSAEGPIEMTVNENEKSSFVSGRFKFNMNGIPASNYPKLPEADGASVELPQNVLKDMIRKTSYSESNDGTRRNLNGSYFSLKDGMLSVVATDGRRLAVCEYTSDVNPQQGFDIVVPSKAVKEIAKNLTDEGMCQITIAKSQALFTIGNVRIYTKLIDECYPNYRQVIPKELKYTITADRNDFADMLTRVSVFSKGDSAQMKFHFDGSVCSVSAAHADVGDASDMLPIKYDGEPIDVTFNPVYMLEAIRSLDEDEFRICINNGASPVVIRRGGTDDFLYVLMPLRIS